MQQTMAPTDNEKKFVTSIALIDRSSTLLYYGKELLRDNSDILPELITLHKAQGTSVTKIIPISTDRVETSERQERGNLHFHSTHFYGLSSRHNHSNDQSQNDRVDST